MTAKTPSEDTSGGYLHSILLKSTEKRFQLTNYIHGQWLTLRERIWAYTNAMQPQPPPPTGTAPLISHPATTDKLKAHEIDGMICHPLDDDMNQWICTIDSCRTTTRKLCQPSLKNKVMEQSESNSKDITKNELKSVPLTQGPNEGDKTKIPDTLQPDLDSNIGTIQTKVKTDIAKFTSGLDTELKNNHPEPATEKYKSNPIKPSNMDLEEYSLFDLPPSMLFFPVRIGPPIYPSVKPLALNTHIQFHNESLMENVQPVRYTKIQNLPNPQIKDDVENHFPILCDNRQQHASNHHPQRCACNPTHGRFCTRCYSCCPVCYL